MIKTKKEHTKSMKERALTLCTKLTDENLQKNIKSFALYNASYHAARGPEFVVNIIKILESVTSSNNVAPWLKLSNVIGASIAAYYLRRMVLRIFGDPLISSSVINGPNIAGAYALVYPAVAWFFTSRLAISNNDPEEDTRDKQIRDYLHNFYEGQQIKLDSDILSDIRFSNFAFPAIVLSVFTIVKVLSVIELVPWLLTLNSSFFCLEFSANFVRAVTDKCITLAQKISQEDSEPSIELNSNLELNVTNENKEIDDLSNRKVMLPTLGAKNITTTKSKLNSQLENKSSKLIC